MDDTALAQAQRTAQRLARVMEAHEVDLARAAEAKLFPGGAPARVTIADLMRALAGAVMEAAQHMAESDAAYNAKRRQIEGKGPSETSLLSQDVAEKIALSVELEDLVLQHADDAGARLERKLFPDGLPERIGLLGIFQALRRRIELASTHDAAALLEPGTSDGDGDSTSDGGGDGDGAPGRGGDSDGASLREVLEREMTSVAQLFAELSEICRLRGTSRAIREVVDLSDLDDDPDDPGVD